MQRKEESGLCKKILLFWVITIYCSQPTYCEIYEYKNAQGYLLYSDRSPSAHPGIRFQRTLLSQATNFLPSNSAQIKTPPTPDEKITIKITSPLPEQTFWNSTQIQYTISVTPHLEPNYIVKVWLDGNEFPHPHQQVNGTLNNLTRGSHSLLVSLQSSDKVLAKSENVTFYVHQGKESAP